MPLTFSLPCAKGSAFTVEEDHAEQVAKLLKDHMMKTDGKPEDIIAYSFSKARHLNNIDIVDEETGNRISFWELSNSVHDKHSENNKVEEEEEVNNAEETPLDETEME